MKLGHWIIHPALSVTLCLHNTEPLLTSISTSTEFTHTSLRLPQHLSTLIASHPSRCFNTCVYFGWFPRHVTLLPLSSPSVFCVTDSMFPPPTVWAKVVTDAACHCCRSDRRVWKRCVGYLHLITWLPLHLTRPNLGALRSAAHHVVTKQGCDFKSAETNNITAKTRQMRQEAKTCTTKWH